MDNLPYFAVIATQAKGQTLIHDWTYEKRALYYTELDKLGADTILADPHRFYVNGPTKLSSNELVCPPALRPAAILLLGMRKGLRFCAISTASTAATRTS
jgi:UDP-N-acetylglucosamine 1-carboxyvinyltransferase